MTEDKSAEIVATCEAAVSHLTEAGWYQGSYTGDGYVTTWSADKRSFVVDYTAAEACLGGALALASVGRTFVDSDIEWSEAIHACPAIPAVAAVIREKYPDMDVRWTAPEQDACPCCTDYNETYDEATVYHFNDKVAETDDDVIDVLNETIKRHTSEVIA